MQLVTESASGWSLSKYTTGFYSRQFITLVMELYDNFGNSCGFVEIRQRVGRVASAIASYSAPPPAREQLEGLNYSCLDDAFKAENRASWNWVDVVGSAFVIGMVIAAYAYFWTWLK